MYLAQLHIHTSSSHMPHINAAAEAMTLAIITVDFNSAVPAVNRVTLHEVCQVSSVLRLCPRIICGNECHLSTAAPEAVGADASPTRYKMQGYAHIGRAAEKTAHTTKFVSHDGLPATPFLRSALPPSAACACAGHEHHKRVRGEPGRSEEGKNGQARCPGGTLHSEQCCE